MDKRSTLLFDNNVKAEQRTPREFLKKYMLPLMNEDITLSTR